MEAVKRKKSRPKEQIPSASEVRTGSSVVQSHSEVLRLPDAPSHDLAVTIEPTEVVIPDKDITKEVAALNVTSKIDKNVITPNVAPSTKSLDLTFCASECSLPVVSTLVPNETSSSILCYPGIPELSTEASLFFYGTTGISVHSQLMEKQESGTSVLSQSLVADAPPLYPSLSNIIYDKNEFGLLTEQHLLCFYHNPFFENAEEFVNNFIKCEEYPSGPLLKLLRRLKELCEQMNLGEMGEKENTESLKKCLRDCWIIQQNSIECKGKCGENREGSGIGNYQSATISTKKVAELKRLLDCNRTLLLNDRISQETEYRSLALQIQWIIISINHQFMSENGLTIHSPPFLTDSTVNNAGRILLLSALSDIFFHLRYPSLALRFKDALVKWATEIVCVLNMCWRCEDGQFVLNHLLRLPSPICDWAPALIQTFIQAPSPLKLKMDYCITMLSHIMSPIKSRELFLQQISQSEQEDSAWTILSSDEEEGEFSLVTISEADLISIWNQLPVSEFYSVAYLYFSNSNSEKSAQFISLIAFQLLLMKVLDSGLSTYSRPAYKQFCKQIGTSLRQSVHELCAHWKVYKNFIAIDEELQLQREVDRIVLLATQYILNRDSSGLWQFIVDMPYDCVSEECRNRCEYMLRTNSKVTALEVYHIPACEVNARIKAGELIERINTVGLLDSVFLLNALAAIVSHSHNDPTLFIKELIDVCFCNEELRENLYKVGGEAIAQLLAHRPTVIDQLLIVLDRNMQHMSNYAIYVFASSTLSLCKISQPVLSVLGKWLINKPPDDPSNRVARKVLSGLHWGYSENGEELWMDEQVHEICAETVVKAHSVHCNNSNGMIEKSFRQISKMASRIPDHEHIFNQFCWDILIKLKLSLKDVSSKPSNDLTAFFIHVYRLSFTSVSDFLEIATPLLNELVSSGSSAACVILLTRMIHKEHKRATEFGASKSFMDVFERIIHVDQCSYAVQWLSGPSSTPTPIVRLICSSISYYSKNVPDIGIYLRAWVDLLCVRRASTWNSDQVTLQVLGSIVRIAFLYDSKSLLGIPEIIYNLYAKMLSSDRESSRGLFSMFATDQPPPPLIAVPLYSISPWATYLLLLVESKSYSPLNQLICESLVMKDKITLEHAVKKAASKLSLTFPLIRLSVFLWAKFISVCQDSPVFPLALQRLATEAFRPRRVNGKNYCLARRIIDAPQGKSIMSECKETLNKINDEKGLARAVSGWLFSTHEIYHTGFDFSTFDLSYLLQLIIADDANIWLDFMDIQSLLSEESQEEKLFSITCHFGRHELTRSAGDILYRPYSLRTQPFPSLPSHPELPPAPLVNFSSLFEQHTIVNMVAPLTKQINSLAEHFVLSSDKIFNEDEYYCESLNKLYSPIVKNIVVSLKCSSRCQHPISSTVQVDAVEFCSTIDAQMNQNRVKRDILWTELNIAILDKTAVSIATMEHISRQVSQLASSCVSNHSTAQLTGRSLFHFITSSLSDNEMLFPAATVAYERILGILGEEFIQYHFEEQMHVMNLVLDGFPLSDPLVQVFTPECMPPMNLYMAYMSLSKAVWDPERSPRALKLLSRLGIDRAVSSLPSHQFAHLLPLAFRNLTSQPDSSAALHVLCLQHVISFIFHAFPANFCAGLDLALDGCKTSVTPIDLLDAFVTRLDATSFANPCGDFALDSKTALECASILSRRLAEARSTLPAMFSVMGKYMDPITKLAQLFLFTPVKESFKSDISLSEAQRDLSEVFSHVQSVFNPLFAPVSISLPPFCPSDENEAEMIIDRFVQLLSALPHNPIVPPTMQNLPYLVWKFYFENLSVLNYGTAHYFTTLERFLIRFHWPSFLPSFRCLSAMDDCLSLRSSDCAPFVTQLIVRIPWKIVLDTHVPDELRPDYLTTFFSILLRVVSNPNNYSKVCASLLNLLKYLSHRADWSTVPAEKAECLGRTVATILPHNSNSSPADVVAVLQIIWRKICCFVLRQPSSPSSLLKQATWVRTECASILEGEISTALPAYNSLIADVHAVANQHGNLRDFSLVARELISMWNDINDSKLRESLMCGFNAYMDANPGSPLLLISLNTLMTSINPDQLTSGLKVIEKTIRAYFKRTSSSWRELMQWVQFPSPCYDTIQKYLLCTPSTENMVYPLFLTLKAFLDCDNHPDHVFFALHKYIICLKPKHIICESSFLLVLSRVFVWLSTFYASFPPSLLLTDDLLHPLIKWLNKAARDDSNFITNLITSKKSSHSSRLRIILLIVELYVTQQLMGEGKRPRCSGGAPVFNSKIHALQEAAAVKANQQFSNAFNVSTSFFVQVDVHHLGSTSQLIMECAQTIFKDKYLTDI